PPAWDIFAFAQIFDDLLDRFVGYTHLFGDLCANSIELNRDGQFFITCLGLFNLLRRRLKRRWRWSFLALRPGWSCRSRRLWLPGLAAALLVAWAVLFRTTLPGTHYSWPTSGTRLYWLAWSLPDSAGDVANARS